MRRKESLKNRRGNQVKLRIRSHRRGIVSNRILIHVKVSILLFHIHLVNRLLHGFGRILIITHLWTIVECICIHILFNILLHVQVMVFLKDRLLLAIIWSKANLIAARMVRRIWSETTNIYSQRGVPPAYLTTKEKAATDAQEEVRGTTNGYTNKVSDREAGMEA